MKFFLTILPLLLGTSSCADTAGPAKTGKTGTGPEARTVGEFVRAGVRYLEPFYGNHVSPYDSHSSHYRSFYGPGYAPTFGRPNYVDVVSPYGYEPYGYGYPHPYPYHGHQGHYYRPYSPVLFREVVPVNVPGEHVHKGHHLEPVVSSSKHHPHHVAVVAHPHHFGLPKQASHYVEDGSATNKKGDEAGIVGSNEPASENVYQRSTGAVIPGVVPPGTVFVPVVPVVPAVAPAVEGVESGVVDGDLEDKSLRKNGIIPGLNNNNRKQNRFPFPLPGKNRPLEAEVHNPASVPESVVPSHDNPPVVQDTPTAVQPGSESGSGSVTPTVGQESVPSVGDAGATLVGVLPAVPIVSSNEPNTPAASAPSQPFKQV